MALLDVNALVALVWDTHVHHETMVSWFRAEAAAGWYTCPITESGFVRVSSNTKAFAAPVSVADARRVLASLRAQPGHNFLADDVSITDADVPPLFGYRQVTDAHLLVLARRNEVDLVTFDRGAAALAAGRGATLLTLGG